MFSISKSPAVEEFSALKLQRRHVGAIASLVLISLLSSASGFSSNHTISNAWEGFLWGMADPVIALNCLVGVVAIGLLSAVTIRGSLIIVSFVLAAVLGTVLHLFQLNLPSTEIAIAISSVGFGMILTMQNRPHWLIIAFLGAIAGLFQGYDHATSIVGTGTSLQMTYIFGAVLTQCTVTLSARQIGDTVCHQDINEILPRLMRFVGCAFLAMGIVFLGNSIN